MVSEVKTVRQFGANYKFVRIKFATVFGATPVQKPKKKRVSDKSRLHQTRSAPTKPGACSLANHRSASLRLFHGPGGCAYPVHLKPKKRRGEYMYCKRLKAKQENAHLIPYVLDRNIGICRLLD
jgi:hypothetical protein